MLGSTTDSNKKQIFLLSYVAYLGVLEFMGRSWSVVIILFILIFSEPYSQENNENINITRMIASLQYICQLVHFCSLY